MELSDAASYFDQMVCLDGYTGDDLFRGQLSLYDDNKRDSETSERRVLSTSPASVIPSRRVIAAAGSRWIVGHANPDDYAGTTIRVGYVLQEAPALARVQTLREACLDLPGLTAYAGRAWVKNAAYTEQNSDLAPEQHVHFSTSETILDGTVVTFAGDLNIVRSTNLGSGGTRIALCDQMPLPAIEPNATVMSSAWNPITESLSGATLTVRALRVRWQSLFEYRNSAAPKFAPGDIQVAIAQESATVFAGAVLGLSDGSWKVQSAALEAGVYLCRASRYV